MTAAEQRKFSEIQESLTSYRANFNLIRRKFNQRVREKTKNIADENIKLRSLVRGVMRIEDQRSLQIWKSRAEIVLRLKQETA